MGKLVSWLVGHYMYIPHSSCLCILNLFAKHSEPSHYQTTPIVRAQQQFDMIYIYPPSPALSACDSLDGIDDLDAYLDAQGPLSRFGTPPLAKETPKFDIQDCFVEDELADDAIAIDCTDSTSASSQRSY